MSAGKRQKKALQPPAVAAHYSVFLKACLRYFFGLAGAAAGFLTFVAAF